MLFMIPYKDENRKKQSMKQKIQFKNYTVNYKGHKHEIIIHPITDRLRIINHSKSSEFQ